MSKAYNWIGTYNNPKVEPQEYLRLWFESAKAVYVVGQLERGENGTPHIQYFLNFKSQQRVSSLKKHCKISHFDPVKVNNGAHTYCMKEETRVDGPWEFGVKPVQRSSRTDWDDVLTKARLGHFEDIPSDIQVRHYGNL